MLIDDVVDAIDPILTSDLTSTDDDDEILTSLKPTQSNKIVSTETDESINTDESTVQDTNKNKAQFAREIFHSMFGKEGIERKHIIQAFQDLKLMGGKPLTPAGASTYYQKLAPKKS